MQHLIASPEELMAKILSDRGIPLDHSELFLKPRYELANPFLFEGIEQAVLRLFSAIEANEPIGIYADYDCDGIPAAVILTDLFNKIDYKDFHIYIPDRHDEGYGLKEQGIDELAKKGVKLIITVDLGITAHAEVAYAQTLGIDCIITDHHTPLPLDAGGFPKAFAVIHPENGDYSNKCACGAGVAFHFVRAFIQKYGEHFSIPRDWEKWLLDMAGFATLSDMVSLTDENRVLAKYGLVVMRKTKRIGLRALLRSLKIDQLTLSEDDLTFMVAPRLNAASRMDSPLHAYRLLATNNPDEAQELVRHLSEINNQRKTLVATTMREAEQKLKDRELKDIIVVGDIEWHPPILGLVAAKLQEAHGKTVFVWGKNGGEEIRGSCRSSGAHNVSILMQKTTEHFLHFGGHAAAGGFSVSSEAIHFLEDKLNEHAEGALQAKAPLSAPYPATLAVVHLKYWNIIEACSPFGVGNEKPQFMFEKISVAAIKQFGKGKEHLEIQVTDSEGNKATAISFFTSVDSYGEPLEVGKKIDLIGTLDRVQGYYGNGVRLRIEDIVVY